jgi:peptidoglycan/xylan/chitin deacetylase (PgdA/CDA1 family)
LTFDDGYKSMAVAGRRALGGRPGVFFVPSDHIGRMNTFEGDGPEPPEMLCDDDDLRLLEQSGLAIESHGASHGTFPDMTAEELRNEAWRSKVELERVVGRTVTTLAYPYGYPGQDPESTAAILAAAGYRCAFVYGGGLVRFPITHRFLLPRLAIGPDTDLPALIQPELEASSWRA